MRTRNTVRLLILNPAGHVLLMKIDDPHQTTEEGSQQKPFWATFGGGVEQNEDIFAAAAREAREETGRTDVRIGKPVWYREVTITVRGEPILFKETYLVAHLDDGELSNGGWTQEERDVIKQVAWWSVADLCATSEAVFPKRLGQLLHPIVHGEYPSAVQRIE